ALRPAAHLLRAGRESRRRTCPQEHRAFRGRRRRRGRAARIGRSELHDGAEPAGRRRRSRPRQAMNREDIAVVGVACLFPGAPDAGAFWRNILGKVDAITDPPPEAWDPALYYDVNATDNDRVYCKK